MGSNQSTDDYSSCGKYLSAVKNIDGKWELSPTISDLSDKQKSDITTIMIGKKNKRLDLYDSKPHWIYDISNVRLLKASWDNKSEQYTATLSLFNGTFIEKTYVKQIYRVGIHNGALLDYIENGPTGEIYKDISAKFVKIRKQYKQ